jgi:putative endonuclease
MPRTYNFWVYIVTNWEKTVFYTGVTNNLAQRLKEHYDNRGNPDTFAGKNYCYNLIYYEWHQYIYNAIGREKDIKDQSREKKLELIQEINPELKFFNVLVCGEWPPTFEGRLGSNKGKVAPPKDYFPSKPPR